jgi:hypothetical protein
VKGWWLTFGRHNGSLTGRHLHVMMLREFATDFQPPQNASNGGTGLYAGEQDLFAFLIDPMGWVEIGEEAYAPGFFVWNSEVGRRSLGIQTFWFQAVCQNHIVWDAIDVCEFSTKHTSKIQDGLTTIRSMIDAIVRKRDERKDGSGACFRVACLLRDAGMTEAEALAEILAWNASGAAQPPWTVRELLHKVQDAFAKTAAAGSPAGGHPPNRILQPLTGES